jgi:hypothetical protein
MGKLSSAFKKPTDKNAAYPYGAINFHSRVDNLFPKSNSVREGAVTLKGSLSMGDGRICLKISAPDSLDNAFKKHDIHDIRLLPRLTLPSADSLFLGN